MRRQETRLWVIFLCVFLLNCGVWSFTREKQAQWLNVPPVPQSTSVLTMFLGDQEFAYRSLGVMLQNLGDMGGRITPLRDYNFPRLAQWFFLMQKLDAHSDYAPYLAAFYFGAATGDDIGEKIKPLVRYLRQAGNSAEGQKWRWLAHAIYLARFKMNDLDYAYAMAKELSDIGYKRRDLPHWTRQMPVFILNAKGNKEEALAIMVSILSSVGDKLDPSEVNFTRGYICEQILTPAQAASNPICQDLPGRGKKGNDG